VTTKTKNLNFVFKEVNMEEDDRNLNFDKDNPKGKFSATQIFWLLVFSIILAAIYAYINIS
jgi:ribosomal protein L4